MFCEVHKTFFYTDLGPNNTCCSQIFDNKPFFGFQGTCYRTKKDKTVVETVPYIYNSVKLWMLMKEEMHPKYKVDFKVHTFNKGIVLENVFDAKNISSAARALTQLREPVSTLPLART